jgi:hypothetical protein
MSSFNFQDRLAHHGVKSIETEELLRAPYGNHRGRPSRPIQVTMEMFNGNSVRFRCQAGELVVRSTALAALLDD